MARRAGGVRRAAVALVGGVVFAACGDTVVVRDGASPAARPVTTVVTATTVPSGAQAGQGSGNAAVRPIDLAGLPATVGRLDGVIVDGARPVAAELGPWVTVRGAVSGYLDERAALSADLSGDGVDEVVLPLRAGPGQPAAGVLVLTPSRTEPIVVGDVAFYRSLGFDTRASVELGELVLRYRVGAGWEPPCCWSGGVVRRMRVVGAAVQEVMSPLEVGEPVAQGLTVDRFYRLLGARQAETAYAMLTAEERRRMLASQWPALFAGADEVTVTVGGAARPDGLLSFRLAIRTGTRNASWLGGAGFVYDTLTHAWLISLLSLQPES
jgi:hypothetical protein